MTDMKNVVILAALTGATAPTTSRAAACRRAARRSRFRRDLPSAFSRRG